MIQIKTTSKVVPKCYAYITPGVPAHDGWTKIGFTERDVEKRINEQTHTVGVDHITCWAIEARYLEEPYDTFTDKDFHVYLKRLGIPREKGNEWFYINPDDAKEHFENFRHNHGVISGENSKIAASYKLREEQARAVQMTYEYFCENEDPEFLWNAKPRFGKTLSTYDLCKKLNARQILIVTNRPAIANSWYQDYAEYLGPQSGYIFVSNVDGIKDNKYVYSRDKYRKTASVSSDEDDIKCIEFVSLQDLKGAACFDGSYNKLSEVKDTVWDILVVDEAHEGVDTYKTDKVFEKISRKYTLHLSGTPFKALANEKFSNDAIFNWTYADEQKRKREWNSSDEAENPYDSLPRISLFTYQMSEIVCDKLKKGIEIADNDIEEYAFDLNEFFKTSESGKFIHDEDVDKFLDALSSLDKFPFSTPELRNELKHTFWILNRVSSAKALAKKLKSHPVFEDYEIVLAAGDGRLDEDEERKNSYNKVINAIKNNDKTITLSVGQLTTGVTVPEWTAVLMLSNMESPALYMQAAFRAQNPCLFTDNNGNYYRKENAYIFDFDPARTLKIFEKFANDLISETSGYKGDSERRKENVRELLNYFPVYGEDNDGSMVELDAEKILTVPRRIHAKEVVKRGFMSNFLFQNISRIFEAPKDIVDAINNMQAIEAPKPPARVNVDESTANNLYLNENGEVEIPEEQIIGKQTELFGEKVYADISDQLELSSKVSNDNNASSNDDNIIKSLYKQYSEPITNTYIDHAKEEYSQELNKSTKNKLEHKIQKEIDSIIDREYNDYKDRTAQIRKKYEQKKTEAQSSNAPAAVITKIEDELSSEYNNEFQVMHSNIVEKLKQKDTLESIGNIVTRTLETEKSNKEKENIENNVRDHLRGFSRTIPAFLMAYGDDNTRLDNFDKLVSEKEFWEITMNPQTGKGVTLSQFRMLRDGGDYIAESGETKHFEGHLFDEIVFNDAIKEFMKKREELANYFEQNHDEDIFDYIPPQRTNQIFTPRKVVKEMVDMLERENPGCFDDPDATFADLYMKSGMYIAEIVKRLFQSTTLKHIYPDETERLNHIFAEQVFGCAPTEIIYRICRRYILGFSDKIHIEKDNIIRLDTLEYAKNGTLEEEVKKRFANRYLYHVIR